LIHINRLLYNVMGSGSSLILYNIPSALVHDMREYTKTAPTWAVQMTEDFEVETLEGVMQASAGDYLCRGPKGEYWPVQREIFESTYQLVEEKEKTN
jgi:hypothetical protein